MVHRIRQELAAQLQHAEFGMPGPLEMSVPATTHLDEVAVPRQHLAGRMWVITAAA